MVHNNKSGKLGSCIIGIGNMMAGSKVARDINRATKGIQGYKSMREGLVELNTLRGHRNLGGFVAEQIEAGEASARGRRTYVLDNNGPADLVHVKNNGTTALKQVKCGYRPKQIDFSRYEDMEVILNKDNPHFQQIKTEGAQAGVNVRPGHFTAKEANTLAKAMKMETTLTGGRHAKIAPHLYQCAKTASILKQIVLS